MWRPKVEPTFRHLLEHPEDGAGPDEGPGLKEVHGGGEIRPPQFLLLVFHQDRVQPLLRLRQHHLAPRLHGGFQLDEGFSLPRVRAAQAATQEVQEQAGHGHKGALFRHSHDPKAASWVTTTGIKGQESLLGEAKMHIIAQALVAK